MGPRRNQFASKHVRLTAEQGFPEPEGDEFIVRLTRSRGGNTMVRIASRHCFSQCRHARAGLVAIQCQNISPLHEYHKHLFLGCSMHGIEMHVQTKDDVLPLEQIIQHNTFTKIDFMPVLLDDSLASI
jgi:hypothetical protein